MATRLGIELSAAAIRLIEVDGHWQPGAVSPPPRVRSFAVLPPTGRDTDAMLAALKRREAAVLVWGTPSEHRQVVVTDGSYEAMRQEGVASLAGLGVRTGNSLADIAPVRGDGGDRRPVVVAVAPADPMLDAIRPLVAAGIRVRSLGTPAMALASMAHTRREVTEPDAIEAYIAVEETATCIALMQGGALAIARELPWGYIAGGALRPHTDIVKRLALELEQYLDAVGAPRASQVCICGGQPELRTTAVLLTERLDVEVEPLDSLFGIDEAHLPEPSADFRERVAELRMAWAVAADWPPRLNLLRARRREQSRRALAAAAVVAGIVAGVGGAWRVARSEVWQASRAPARRSSPVAANPRSATPTAANPRPASPSLLASKTTVPFATQLARVLVPPVSSPPDVIVRVAPPPTPSQSAPQTPLPPAPASRSAAPPPAPPSRSTPPTLSPPSSSPRSGPQIPAPPASSPRPGSQTPPPPARSTPATLPPPASSSRSASAPPAVPPSPVTRSTPSAAPATPITPPPAILQRPAPAPGPSPARAPVVQAPPRAPAPAPSTQTAAPTPPRPRPTPVPTPSAAAKAEPVLPFSASLETILFGPDRKLAIIDGQIVGVGDVVRGARIVDISATVVMLRDDQGRLRRLALGAGSK